MYGFHFPKVCHCSLEIIFCFPSQLAYRFSRLLFQPSFCSSHDPRGVSYHHNSSPATFIPRCSDYKSILPQNQWWEILILPNVSALMGICIKSLDPWFSNLTAYWNPLETFKISMSIAIHIDSVAINLRYNPGKVFFVLFLWGVFFFRGFCLLF